MEEGKGLGGHGRGEGGKGVWMSDGSEEKGKANVEQLGKEKGYGGEGDEGGWCTVQRKRGRASVRSHGRVDVAGSGEKLTRDTVSFYFSDFPSTHGAKEMMKAFAFYGRVVEVVIPPKKNKWGKRFGFARFLNVQDPRLFAVKLDNIMFGADKIHVNIPRFTREYQAATGRMTADGKKEVTVPMAPRIVHGKEDVGRNKMVWKEVVRGNITPGNNNGVSKDSNATEQKIVYFRKQNLCDVWYKVSEEDLSAFKNRYVAEVRHAGSTHMAQEWFNMQGVFSIKATPMGANLVLLEEMEEGFIKALIEDEKDWLAENFSAIRPWNELEVDNERVVWVRCHGVPLHAWNNDFFSAIARKFGTFLGVDENTRKMKSLDVARIQIRTKSYDVFNMVVHAKINDMLYHVKVLEEWCGLAQWGGLSTPNEHCGNEDFSDSDEGSEGPPQEMSWLVRKRLGKKGYAATTGGLTVNEWRKVWRLRRSSGMARRGQLLLMRRCWNILCHLERMR